MSIPMIGELAYLEKSLSAFRIDKTGTHTYIGRCKPEDYDNIDQAVWQIQRFDSTNGEGGQYANGEREANKVWNDRSTYF